MAENKRKKSLFLRIYILVTLLLVAMIDIIWAVLWVKLEKYENSLPKYAIEGLIEDIQSGDCSALEQFAKLPDNIYDDEETVNNAVAEYVAGVFADGEWTYVKKVGEYTDSNPVYYLKKDGEKTDYTVYYSKSTSDGKTVWNIDDVTGLYCEGTERVITVPDGSQVYVDGVLLGDEYITETADANVLSNVAKYIETPTMSTYTLGIVYSEHEIKATGPVYGTELACVNDEDGKAEYGFEVNETLVSEQEANVIQAAKMYGEYVVNYRGFGSLSSYILKGSYAYSYLSNIARTNVWLKVKSEPVFSNMVVFNWQSYTQDCFSCEITFDETVTYTNGNTQDYQTHIEYIYVLQDGKWYVGDMILLN